MARSRRRRRIDVISVWASVAAAISATIPARTRGTSPTPLRLLISPDTDRGSANRCFVCRFTPLMNLVWFAPGTSRTKCAHPFEIDWGDTLRAPSIENAAPCPGRANEKKNDGMATRPTTRIRKSPPLP